MRIVSVLGTVITCTCVATISVAPVVAAPMVSIVVYSASGSDNGQPVWTGQTLHVNKDKQYRIEIRGFGGTIPDGLQLLQLKLNGAMHCQGYKDNNVYSAGPFWININVQAVQSGQYDIWLINHPITDSYFTGFQCPPQLAVDAPFSPNNASFSATIHYTSNAGIQYEIKGANFTWP